MKTSILIIAILSSFNTMCNMTFLNHKGYELKLKDFVWNIKIEGQVGEIYLKESNFIFGRNWDSTFVVISSDNGAILDTLHPYTIEKEKESLIIDGTGEHYDGYSLYNVPVDKHKYSKVTLRMTDRKYRGDTETSYLIINTLSNQEFTILFNRRQFPDIADIAYYRDGKFVMKHNVTAGSMDNKIPYIVHIGLFDLGKIIKE